MRIALAPSLLLATALLAGSPAGADAPNCQTAPPLKPGALKVWPLHVRLPNDTPGETRSSLMNDFGEFQSFGADLYVHTGIDIRGLFDGGTQEGDLVLAAASGDIWAVPGFTVDGCALAADCRVYIKSPDRRHIYYYAHLSVRSDADSDLRAKLEEASTHDPAADLPPGSSPVAEGAKLAGIGPFNGAQPHLHFAIFDVCENYDGLNPLLYLPAPEFQGKPFLDHTPPTIGPIRFVRQDGATEVKPGTCDNPLSGVVDLVVEAKDAYHDLTAGAPPFSATNSSGVYKAVYRIVRTPTSPPQYDGTWYQFDRAPFRCRGSARGKSCADPDPANAALLTQNDFIQKVCEFPPIDVGAPSLGVTFSTVSFDNVGGPFQSNSQFSGNERYFHLLTNEWGRPDAPGGWDTAAMPDGLYQVSAEVSDAAGNKAARHAFVLLDNHPGPPDPTGNLVLRDNPDDVGAVPSTLGGNPFWISPDIKVLESGTPAPNDPDDAIWSTSQDVAVELGKSYEVWIRVANRGCQDLHDVRAKVAWADPAMIQTSWQAIDVEQGGGTLAPDTAMVLGPYKWTPTVEGHRCLLAISRSTEDPPSVADFGTIVAGWGGTVANDSDISQLNLQVGTKGKKSFKLNVPATAEGGARLAFSCNDFPLGEEGALAELVAGETPGLLAAWANVPGTSVAKKGKDLVLRFQACHVEVALAPLQGGHSVDAEMRLILPPGPPATFRVDLAEVVGNRIAGGMSFEVSRP